MSRSRNFVFTLNNYVELPELREGMKYLCYGKEVSPTTGTPHLQGFVVYIAMKALTQVFKDFPGAHVEKAKGSPEQCIVYCKKDGDYIELGVAPVSPKKKGESEIARWELARSSAMVNDLMSIPADIYTRYYRTLKEIAKDHMVKPPDNPNGVCGVWYTGPAGCGKSRTARKLYPGAYDKMCNKWWDGYQGEKYVIIDDLDKKHGVSARRRGSQYVST
jgi:hypothetical protein